MSRLNAANVLATSGRAVRGGGDVYVLLLDKTGTITLGNRQAAAFLPLAALASANFADAAQLASLADRRPRTQRGGARQGALRHPRSASWRNPALRWFPSRPNAHERVDFEVSEIAKFDAVRAYV